MTTPGTPPSRTIRFEPSPITLTGTAAGSRDEKIGEIVLVRRREQHLGRPADAEPGDLRERSAREQAPAQLGHGGARSATMFGLGIPTSGMVDR